MHPTKPRPIWPSGLREVDKNVKSERLKVNRQQTPSDV